MRTLFSLRRQTDKALAREAVGKVREASGRCTATPIAKPGWEARGLIRLNPSLPAGDCGGELIFCSKMIGYRAATNNFGGIMDEKVLYQRGSITVTPTRLIANGNTIALSTISSVTMERSSTDDNANKAIGALFLGMVALFFFGQVFWAIIALALLIVAGFGSYQQSQKKSVKLLTTGGHVNWIRNAPPEDVGQLVASLNDAIVMRG